MTIKELIEALSKYDGKQEIYFMINGDKDLQDYYPESIQELLTVDGIYINLSKAS